jgi:hypothetical protein
MQLWQNIVHSAAFAEVAHKFVPNGESLVVYIFSSGGNLATLQLSASTNCLGHLALQQRSFSAAAAAFSLSLFLSLFLSLSLPSHLLYSR